MTYRPTQEELQARWQRGQKNERGAYRVEPKRKRGRATETAAALDAMFHATGNKAYAAAFQAMQDDGFIRLKAGTNGAVSIESVRGSWKWQSACDKQAEAIYLAHMDQLVRKWNDRQYAAARTAVDFFIPGASFDAVMTRLENSYRKFHGSRTKSRKLLKSARLRVA
jgi:hypothetical protein